MPNGTGAKTAAKAIRPAMGTRAGAHTHACVWEPARVPKTGLSAFVAVFAPVPLGTSARRVSRDSEVLS